MNFGFTAKVILIGFTWKIIENYYFYILKEQINEEKNYN